jgi:hypothetical protein
VIKRISIGFIAILLTLLISSCKCAAEKQSVDEVENSHKIIATMFLEYVDKDDKLTAQEKARRHTLVDTDLENIQKLKKAMGN